MSKVMSMLEKYNFVEKVNEEKTQNTNSNEESKMQLEEISGDENNISIVEEKELIKKEEPDIKKANIEYEKKMMVDEIYSLFGLENSSINTVFMLQNLINALPQTLPKDVIKESVINIVNASQIDLNVLLSDGEKRMEALTKVMDGYNNHTNRRVAEYKIEIANLSKLISNCQELIKNKEAMLEDQEYMIKSETQKIEGIIDYFSK